MTNDPRLDALGDTVGSDVCGCSRAHPAEHVCTCGGAAAGRINFDRSICACGLMHYFCDDCGFQVDACQA